MPLRKAEKAGAWYPSDPAKLRALLDECLPDAADALSGREPIAALVPHAGLSFSGAIAGAGYAVLSRTTPKVVLIFGAVHTMPLAEPAIWPSGAWQTPLGEVEIDVDLVEALHEAGVGTLDDMPHYGDNAIELQMPFVKHCFPGAKVVAIATPPNDLSAERGRAARRVVADAGAEAVVVGSTDLTHYGPSFAFTPKGTGEDALAWVKQNDRALLELIAGRKVEKILPRAAHDHSACGAGAAAALAAYADEAGAEGEILAQTTSHDIMPEGEPSHFVGYGTVVFGR
jgi:hypothetical protein